MDDVIILSAIKNLGKGACDGNLETTLSTLKRMQVAVNRKTCITEKLDE